MFNIYKNIVTVFLYKKNLQEPLNKTFYHICNSLLQIGPSPITTILKNNKRKKPLENITS